MSAPEEQFAEYPCIKFEGTRVEAGNVTLADLREIIAGIEHTTKYFIATEYPSVKKDSYEIEVHVEPGSLIAWLVGIVLTGGAAVGTAFGIGYANSAGSKLAENDIGDKTSKDILSSAFNKAKETARIAKHVGGMAKQRQFPEAKIIDANTILLPNDKGEEIQVTPDALETYAHAPRDTFKKLAALADSTTTVQLYAPGEIVTPDRAVVIDGDSKQYFSLADADDDGVVFPEWQHGEQRTLRGALCRANTNTETLGFAYEGHTLTSYLYQMDISSIKDSLFDKEVEIEAVVIRTQKMLDAEDELKRPKLEIRKITTIGELEHTERHLNATLDLE